MINKRRSGYIVKTKTGKLGRTFHDKGEVNGKIPVYLATVSGEYKGEQVPMIYSETAILCDPNGLKQIGFID